ncbi:hypothetical protein [Aurantiacibacter rhizosphaerae]|uniref:2OG-Fe(II) oxygenase n=1 Tax=Aurantiacibacter rhizosphaerae TaxID=2691582 RepID=A0A844XAH9_9SPHN|nr:hypothetical protein [Aurantiacibacter rhizosphaerae]MWV26535.1 hypothetical protein [Aurantiacibacter rhizosphaerae]
MSRFDYLIEKISKADFLDHPFRHVYITDFLLEEDFKAITKSPEINVEPVSSDGELFEVLQQKGYKPIQFPGCITNKQEYMDWHRSRKSQRYVHSACEGFGMTLRLYNPSTPILEELISFLSSDAFNRALAEKFDLDFENCKVDNGIQKYLDGYEISPHPDIRRKAATFMVNINPHADSEERDHHTHYLQLKDEHSHVRKFWDANLEKERCWVPWDWCDVVKTQPENNSIVLFAPGNDTMHAVRARYDHLDGQRTQLYGNLWHSDVGDLPPHDWELFELASGKLNWGAIKRTARDHLPQPVVSMAKKALRRGKADSDQSADLGTRSY